MEKSIVIDMARICRICLAVKTVLCPLIGEEVAEQLMEIAQIQPIEQIDGWPEKICLQCFNQVKRSHLFKTRAETADITLREYIKLRTEQAEREEEEELSEMSPTPPNEPIPLQQVGPAMVPQQLHEHQIQQTDVPSLQAEAPVTPAIILNNTQLIDPGAQIMNAGHIITTATGQPIIQTTPQFPATPIGQFIQGPNNTVQMFTQDGYPVHVLQIQQTADDLCEIIVQPEMTVAHYLENGNGVQYLENVNGVQYLENVNGVQYLENVNGPQYLENVIGPQYLENVSSIPMIISAPTNAIPTETLQVQQLHQHGHLETYEAEHHIELEESEDVAHLQETVEDQQHEEDTDCMVADDETVETDEMIDEEEGVIDEAEIEYIDQTECEELDDDEGKDTDEATTDFLTYQTSCPSPGRYICHLCCKEFTEPKWLKQHMSSHTNWIKAYNKKNAECMVCHKILLGPGRLRLHMKLHEKVTKTP